jgi:hypothetical protein
MSLEAKIKCFNCGKVISFPERVGFRDECEHCHADARVCRNCKFYDVKAYNECREPSAEVVQIKDRSNRCDYFQPNGGGSEAGAGASAGSASAKDDLLAAAEALFKKKD